MWNRLLASLLCLVPAVLLSAELATAAPGARPLWQSLAVVAGPFMALGALSAAGSLWLAQRAARRGIDQDGPPHPDVIARDADVAALSADSTWPGRVPRPVRSRCDPGTPQ